MGKYRNRISRISYLKEVLKILELDPKQFMLAVTYKSHYETALYKWINALYAKKVPFEQVQTRIERAEQLYKCDFRDGDSLGSEYRFFSAS